MVDRIAEETYRARIDSLSANLIINNFPALTAANIANLLDLLVTHPEIHDGPRLLLRLARDAALHLSEVVRKTEQRKMNAAASFIID